jgi:hypothetical protein
MNTPPPSYVSYSPAPGNYLQTLIINIENANLAMGTTMSMSFTNSIKARYQAIDYLTPFKITLFKCYDTLCEKCSFDSVNELIGSKLCTQCGIGSILENIGCTEICGDGLMIGDEVCDDGGQGGCFSDCTKFNANFTCVGGNATSPSLCSCNSGY